MIPRAHIIEWQKNAPWQNNSQIEQDLVIERVLVELFSDNLIRNNLAFRGGTALHKIYLKPQVRYSEDIDLVQVKPGPIGPILDQIRNRLAFLGKKGNVNQNEKMTTIIYKFTTEIEPVIDTKLKIEINCREHFSELGWIKTKHNVQNSYFSGNADIVTYYLEELLGTKLRALYQRKKGRDLFDLYYSITNASVDYEKILQCYKKYMDFSNCKVATSKEFISNMENKMKDDAFVGDIESIIRPDIKYDINEAFELIKNSLLEKI